MLHTRVTQGYCSHVDKHRRVQQEAAFWAQGKPSRCPDGIFCLLRQMFTYFTVVVSCEHFEVSPLDTCELLLVLETESA